MSRNKRDTYLIYVMSALADCFKTSRDFIHSSRRTLRSSDSMFTAPRMGAQRDKILTAERTDHTSEQNEQKPRTNHALRQPKSSSPLINPSTKGRSLNRGHVQDVSVLLNVPIIIIIIICFFPFLKVHKRHICVKLNM